MSSIKTHRASFVGGQRETAGITSFIEKDLGIRNLFCTPIKDNKKIIRVPVGEYDYVLPAARSFADKECLEAQWISRIGEEFPVSYVTLARLQLPQSDDEDFRDFLLPILEDRIIPPHMATTDRDLMDCDYFAWLQKGALYLRMNLLSKYNQSDHTLTVAARNQDHSSALGAFANFARSESVPNIESIESMSRTGELTGEKVAFLTKGSAH